MERKQWFKPGKGILSYYLARCGIIAGIVGNTIVSHAGICKRHIESGAISKGREGHTWKVRIFLLSGNTSQETLDSWYNTDGVMIHRFYDIPPYTPIKDSIKKELKDVTNMTGISI
mgnify:CR=1 FL=1